MTTNKLSPVSGFFDKASCAEKSTLHQNLLKTIATIEKRPAQLCEAEEPSRAKFGIEKIDKALDPVSAKGIVTNSLHEIRVASGLDAASGAGFALCLGLVMSRLSSLTRNPGNFSQPPIFWISDSYTRQEYGNYYGPGLCALGFDPKDLIRIHPHSLEESLWAAGEISATKGATRFCLMEIRGHPKALDLTATRRLMLRAQSAKTPVIILRQSGKEEASAATTRWHVTPAASRKAAPVTNPLMHQFIGPPAFSIRLEKCRGGNAALEPFIVEWNSNDQCFALSKDHARPEIRTRLSSRDNKQYGSKRAASAVA